MGRKLKEFKGKRSLYIETIDTRLVAHPYTIYGQEYNGAVGKIFRIDWKAEMGGAEYMYGILKSIQPELPKEQCMIPVTIISEEVYAEEGVIVLQARIEYDKWAKIEDDKSKTVRVSRNPIDVLRLDRKEIRLDVYLPSAEILC